MKIRRILVVVSYVAMIVFNGIGGSLFGNNDVGQQSDRYVNSITPAGYTFAIWGIIFAATLGYAVYQGLPRTQDNSFLDRLAPFAISAFVTTGIWVPIFTGDFLIIANLIMLSILVSLTLCTIVIINHARRRGLSTAERWLVQIPFSIFLGWITVATIANFSLTLTAFEWAGFGLSDVTWSVVMLIIAGFVASFVAYAGRGDIAYALTLVWALIGVMVGHSDKMPVVVAAIGAAVLITGVAVYTKFSTTGRSEPAEKRPGFSS